MWGRELNGFHPGATGEAKLHSSSHLSQPNYGLPTLFLPSARLSMYAGRTPCTEATLAAVTMPAWGFMSRNRKTPVSFMHNIMIQVIHNRVHLSGSGPCIRGPRRRPC